MFLLVNINIFFPLGKTDATKKFSKVNFLTSFRDEKMGRQIWKRISVGDKKTLSKKVKIKIESSSRNKRTDKKRKEVKSLEQGEIEKVRW